jgi:hypothetical protein
MDIGALASSVTTALVPLLPYLLKAGEKGGRNRQDRRGPGLRAPVGDFVGRKPEIDTLMHASAQSRFKRGRPVQRG